MKDELTKEQFLEEIFDDISEKLTPNFSKDDWLKLYERTNQGDPISAEMFMRMWNNKVVPHLNEDFKKMFEGN